MKPFSPVVSGFEDQEIVLAKNQSAYLPLPALPVDDGQRLITRWKLSWRERLSILFRGDLYLWVWTFGRPLHAVFLDTAAPALKRKQAA